MKNVVLYISYTKINYSLNAVYTSGLEKNGVEVWPYKLNSKSILGHIGAIIFVLRNKKFADALMIGYDSSVLAFLLRPFYGGKMIYCAVLPVYERLIISRRLAGTLSPKSWYYWLIDFLAYHSANLSMIESNEQINYISKKYFVSKNKFIRSWIGVDEINFFHNPEVNKLPTFTVLFRGALMPEAGGEYVVRAAKILEKEGINFIMLSGGMLFNQIKNLVEEVNPKNLELKPELLPYDELRTIMQKCHLSLGQLSDHPRLDRTIPHKVYESLALKLPYLTANNKAIQELVKDGETCLVCERANAESLAEKIIWAKNNYQELERIAENGHKLYLNELQSKILAKNLLDKAL